MTDPFDALRVAYEQGQRDAIAAALHRLEAIPWTSETWTERAAIISAIKGDQP